MMVFQTTLIQENQNLEACTKLKQLVSKLKKLPLSLGQALDRLAEDEVIKSAMPDEMYKVFHWYKNDEWEKFLGNNSMGSGYLSRLSTIGLNKNRRGKKICVELQD
jgi:hypothetical protein